MFVQSIYVYGLLDTLLIERSLDGAHFGKIHLAKSTLGNMETPTIKKY